VDEFVYLRDSRQAIQSLAQFWPAQRRERYLLRDVTFPLSADYRVWPRVGEDNPTAMNVLITALDENPRLLQVRLAIAIMPQAFRNDDMWKCVGYDVCDATLLSGLLNCGYQAQDKEKYKATALELNEWHLFRTPRQAEAYAELSNGRIPEHQPFGVFGVYVSASGDV